MTHRIGLGLLLGLLLSMAPVLHPEPVSAASGVDDYPARLKNAAQDSLVDPWLFYNRECTSWVAWRLNSENGVAFDNYWLGVHWGNASNWRNAAKAAGVPVDNNPTRGAVAWWSAGSAGSSVGHVAWVEAVGNGAITIEEYNYLHRGGYDVRTISSTSSMWPSGFIHVKDTQIRNTASPTVTGTPQVGVKLVTTNGTWSATQLTYHYQWLANGVAISGATKRSFVPSADQLGQRLQAKVTATKSGAHSGTAQSAPTASVAKGVFTTTAPPTVSGTAQVGVPLSVTAGTWSPTGTFTYQWYSGGQPVAGATDTTFTPTATQLGQRVRVRVTATADGYTTARMASNLTTAVAKGQFQVVAPPTVNGTPQVDQPLTASPGQWSPAGATSLQWLADGQPIAGATGSTYVPTPDDLRKQISVQVTATQTGYADAVATSAPTAPVAPGTFLNTRAPAIVGTAQVGVQLRADKGAWSPKATISYQWQVGGIDVPGATQRTFTPRPADMGRPVTLEVSASRPGYLTAVVPSTPSADTLPGIITNTVKPVVTGSPTVGHVLSTSDGTWSLVPEAYGYQWYDGSTPIAGADQSSYQVTDAEAGHRLHVVVTAHALGYSPQPAASAATARVVFGTATEAKPTITGRAVVGRTLRAHVATFAPTTGVPQYRWYRGTQPIRGARQATYVLRPADVGHGVHVEVTLRATNWTPVTRRSAAVRGIEAVPVVTAVPVTSRNGHVLLHLRVHAPGLTAPSGEARVLLGSQGRGFISVVRGFGRGWTRVLPSGTHTLTVVYHGGTNQTWARTTVTVTVP